MTDNDDIPLLTDVVRRERRAEDRLSDEQIQAISAASAGLIVRVVKDALADVERKLALTISRELNEQLPRIIVDVMRRNSDNAKPEKS